MSAKGSKKGGKPRASSSNPKIINANRAVPKGNTHLRSKDTINRLAMYRERAHHDKNGKFLSGRYMSRTPDAKVKRVLPDRRWFGNTRVVGQKELNTFREEMGNQMKDRYSVVMKHKKLPMALLNNPFEVRCGSSACLLFAQPLPPAFFCCRKRVRIF